MYVVLNLWKERASVAGVGADLASAEEIAARIGEPYSWGRWWSGNPDSGTMERRARWADGSPHPDHRQEIVRVPLAGMVDWSSKTRELPPPIADGPWAGWHPMGATAESSAPPELTVDRLREVVAELHGKRSAIDEVCVGAGPAWEWLKAGLDKLTNYPSDAPMPDSRVAAMIWGVPVRLDPNVPKDEIQMGDTVFIVGSEGGRVRPGNVVRMDEAEFQQVVRENTMRDLREHLRLGRDDLGYHPEG